MNNFPEDEEPLLPVGGNYRKLFTFQKAEAIYDITWYFCNNYINRFDRTFDQMIQAARSGKQNIAEGSAASVTSKETEIKLINVAKSSSQELMNDYQDYLRTRGHREWEKGSVEVEKMRELGREHNDTGFYMPLVKVRPPETIANIALCLLRQNDYLLSQQLKSLGEDFLNNGGLRERMTRMRKNRRTKNDENEQQG